MRFTLAVPEAHAGNYSCFLLLASLIPKSRNCRAATSAGEFDIKSMPRLFLGNAMTSRMLDLHKQLAEAKTAHGKTNIQRQIDATDAQIDKLVYELYDLSDEQIKIVEGATA
jgi:hypothetical protein